MGAYSAAARGVQALTHLEVWALELLIDRPINTNTEPSESSEESVAGSSTQSCRPCVQDYCARRLP